MTIRGEIKPSFFDGQGKYSVSFNGQIHEHLIITIEKIAAQMFYHIFLHIKRYSCYTSRVYKTFIKDFGENVC